MVTVTIDTGFGEKFSRSFTRFERAFSDMREPFRLIVDDFYETERDIFLSQGKPVPFRALTPGYRKWKNRHFPGKTIMRLHDNLFAALTGGTPSDVSAAKRILKIRRDSLTLGVESPYIETQARAGRRAIQLSQETRIRWGSIIHRWAYEKLKGV